MKKLLISIISFLIISVTTIKSQEIIQLGYYNVNGISSIASESNFMLPGNGSIVNISTPSTPVLNGSISITNIGTSVLVDSNFAYYGTGMSVNLIIANISNPNMPLQVGSKFFPQLNGGVFGLAKSNDFLFLAMGVDGIYSVDVSDKSNPIVVDSVVIPNGQSRGIATSGNFAYVAHYDGLKIIDITDPANLNVITTIGSGYESIELYNNLAFAGKTAGGIDIFDITNPNVPVSAFAIVNSAGTAWDLKIKDDLVYLATNDSGLFIYKFNSSSATEMAHFSNSGNGQSFAVCLQDSLILLSGLINGVAILMYDSLGIVGVKNANIELDQTKIFPNPSNDYIRFSNANFMITYIEIFNCIGMSVKQFKVDCENCLIDVSSLPIGNYTVYLENIKRKSFQKLIKTE